jgi:hypothetical protein
MPRAFPSLLLAAALTLVSSACDRRIEPFDPDEQVEAPDLSKIFPPGAERAPADGSLAQGMGGRGAPPPTKTAETSEGAPIRGRVVLAPELAGRVPATAVLFLIARAGEAGPPTAVKRVASPRFPLDFEIGPDDRMIETMPFSGPFRLSARIDADGSATSRNPGDLRGESPERVKAGASGVELVIDEIL